MIVITSGNKYIDIDAYASCIAYRELLLMQNIEAKFISNATLNYSITDSLLELPLKMDKHLVTANDKIIVLDVSNKDYFDNCINKQKIIEIIDHHPGYEKCWQDNLNIQVQIEEIGSVATIIYEKYVKDNKITKMKVSVAKLLIAAILDNTLNFTANITKERDKVAYKNLMKIVKDDNFTLKYFRERQDYIVKNLRLAILNDIKLEKINKYLPEVFGQLLIWDITIFLDRENEIRNIMNEYQKDWIINIISLKESKSYIFCSNKIVSQNIKELLTGTVKENLVVTKNTYLRKEIIKCALNKGNV